jgi:tetratricopeptide (TPR) repeat protein
MALGDHEDASRWFKAALALAPDSAEVKVQLARACLLDKRPKDSIEALAGIPPSRDSHVVLGAALAALQNWTAAIGAFEHALAAGPPTVDLLNALGNAQLQAGRRRAAAGTFERSLALAPDQPAVRSLLETARRQ